MGEIRWKSFAKQNIQTAYIRANKGTTFEDGAFRDNWNGSKDTDISVGAYHVLELDTDGTKQAEHFINAVGEDLSGRLIPAVEVRLRGLYRLLPVYKSTAMFITSTTAHSIISRFTSFFRNL